MRHLWTAANGLMLFAFVFSVIVQFNDPDPLLWATIYTLAAIVCGLELWRRTPPLLPTAIAIAAVAWAATLAPGVIGEVPFRSMFAEFEMANIAVEESREMYGLLLIAMWMIAVAVASWHRGPGKRRRS